jgi:hypothetical protein
MGWKLLSNDSGWSDSGATAADLEPAARKQVGSFYPLTMPLTVGPGSISVAITIGSRKAETPDSLPLLLLHGAGALAGVIAIAATIYLSYRFASRVARLLGETGVDVLVRLSAFVLICIGIQIIWSGYSALTAVDHHLHPDRRGAPAGDPRLPARRQHLRQAGRHHDRRERHLGRRAHPGELPRAPDAGAQRVPDALAELGKLTLTPEANIIKLPNISASVGQLQAAIKELQGKGYNLPDYPADPKTDEEKDIKARYGKCIGSSVNPVLREGNSDRRAPKAVKEYARKNPHSMGEWSQASRTHVSHMTHGDFYHGEKSMTLDRARDVKMELVTKSGQTIVLKQKVALQDGEIIDSMFMSRKALLAFYEQQIADAKKTGVMFSLHVKATMMKVSHPIVFGHCVRTFYKEAFDKHGALFDSLGVNVNNGMADLYNKIEALPDSQREEIIRDIHACQEHRPELAMVDSAKGITNFHSPNDVIVDASMPAMIRAGGKMYGADGRLKEVKAVIPESTFARIYQEIINFCKWHGAFDPRDHGHRAERRPDGAAGRRIRLARQDLRDPGSRRRQHHRHRHRRSAAVAERREGDIWRMCQVKDAPIRDWVKLAVTRARNSGMPPCSGSTRTVRTRMS